MKLSQIAATLVLGAVCTMPAMAQSQGSGAAGASSQPNPAPATSSGSDTKAMSASPAQMDTGSSTRETPRETEKHDYGWIGLLGLAGLLGMRRKHEDAHVHTEVRPNATR